MIKINAEAFFFDFDGVIVDSERQHMWATLEVLKDQPHLHFSEDEYFNELLGFDDVGIFEFLWKKHNLQLSKEILNDLLIKKNHIYMQRVKTHSFLFPGVKDFIVSLKKSGLLLCIVSGSRRQEILSCIQSQQLHSYFEFIVSADDVRHSKPDPESYQKAFTQMSVLRPGLQMKNCWAIEDSPFGITSAKSTGLNVVGITNSLSAIHLHDADCVVRHYSELSVTKIF